MTLTSSFASNQISNILSYFVYPIKLLLMLFNDVKPTKDQPAVGIMAIAWKKKHFLFWGLQAYSKSNDIISNGLSLKICPIS